LQLPQKKESAIWLLKPINKALGDLQAKFPNASFFERQDEFQKNALSIFIKTGRSSTPSNFI
jgi:hypothetical protein